MLRITAIPIKAPRLGCGATPHKKYGTISTRRSRSSQCIRAIGFDLPNGSPQIKSPEKSADELCRAAASILLYQNVATSKPAQSFLNILLHLQKGSPLKLIEHYSEFYKSLEEWSSWQDFLMDQTLRGLENPFSRAAARSEPSSHFLPAVAHDLSVLQSLAVTEVTLAGWMQQSVSNLPESWTAAAPSFRPPSQPPSSSSFFTLPQVAPAHILAPLTKAQRAALRSELCRLRWGDAAELLQMYHASYGFGLVSMHTVLKWTGDRFQAQDVLEGRVKSGDGGDGGGGDGDGIREAMTDFFNLDLSDRSTGVDNSIIIVSDSARRSYSAAIRGLQQLQGTSAVAAGMRIVILPQKHLKDVAELAWSMSQHPRMRFAVVCPNLPRDIDGDVAAVIGGDAGFEWPVNSVFIGCCAEGEAPPQSKLPSLCITLAQ